MIGKRSRQGCEECRKRRRKCDEVKPVCGPCGSHDRTCNYTLKLIWGGRPNMAGGLGLGAAAPAAWSVSGPGVGGSGGSSNSRAGSGRNANSASASTSATTNTSAAKRRARAVAQAPRAPRAPRQTSQGLPQGVGSGSSSLGGPAAGPVAPSEAANADGKSDVAAAVAPGALGYRAAFDERYTATTTATTACTRDTLLTSTALTIPPTLNPAPPCLPNGVPLSPPYQRLLDYFTKDILASLSVHPSIHQDLCQGLVPTMLHSPHLLSAGLALSAAGLVSRGLVTVAGVDIARVIEHLQASGLSLLRQALQRGVRNSVVMATCLLWCLADVFAAGRDPALSHMARAKESQDGLDSEPGDASSWRIHLQGIKALLGGDQAFDTFVTSAGSSRSAMRHLYLLYLSLQTLPFVPADGRRLLSAPAPESAPTPSTTQSLAQPPLVDDFMPETLALPADAGVARIDGFLGYSEELLDVLQEIDRIARMSPASTTASTLGQATPAPLPGPALAAANVLLGKAQGLVQRDTATAPAVMIAGLSAASRREFVLCHRCFQQATLIHLYRRLFRMPSCAAPIQAAVARIHRMAGQMTQGTPCSTWVAMSMPLFTVGCEACTPAQQAWSHASLDTLAASIGSAHVRVVRQALEDVWRLRARRGDTDGQLCAGQLLDELNYNIILF